MIDPIIQEVYYYVVGDDKRIVIDEEETLNAFKDKLAEIVLNNMGIS
jgi:hypothetical protein